MTKDVEMAVKLGTAEAWDLNEKVLDAYYQVRRDMLKEAKDMVRLERLPWDYMMDNMVAKSTAAQKKLIADHSLR